MIRALNVPAPIGQWLVNGNRMVCRLPRKTVTVRAPKQLLLNILKHCNGQNPWFDVIAQLNERWEIGAVKAFMQHLVREGVLVEASLQWAHGGELAQIPSTTAITATMKELGALSVLGKSRLLPGAGRWTSEIAEGENYFACLLGRRESTRTFDDQPISAECLHSVLWAAQGVTRPGTGEWPGLHRTIASGGDMHSVRLFVAVLRELHAERRDGIPCGSGVYEVRFNRLGGTSLVKLSRDVNNAWRCLRDPRVLRFASAVVMPVYDMAVPGMKYGNRATLFALMEAGQALQNAQLMSFELGASSMLRGDTIADECLSMLGLQNGKAHWFSVPCMVLGAHPSKEQLKQQQVENIFKVAPNLGLKNSPFAFAFTATPAVQAVQASGQFLVASGRSECPKLALTKAEAEGWERMGWALPEKLEIGRFAEIEGAVDPRDLVSYSARQYAQKDFPCRPFSHRRQYLWASAVDISDGARRAVLAETAYANSTLPLRFQKVSFTKVSSSGMAAGTSLEDALCRAALELIERDAFVCAWLTRKAPPVVAKRSIPLKARRRIDELTGEGFDVVVSNLSSEWSPIVSVFAQSSQMPLTIVAAAAHFSSEQALDKALDEVVGRIAHARHFPVPSLADVNPLHRIERFYRSRGTFTRSDFYADSREKVTFSSVGRNSCHYWDELRSRIIERGFILLAVEMTPANAAIEQGRVPLHVVRAIIPGLVPIWFQQGMQPEGMARFRESAGVYKGRPGKSFFVHPFT